MPNLQPGEPIAEFDTHARARIADAVGGERAASRLAGYFAGPVDAALNNHYTGRLFQRLGGGGDRPTTAGWFTAEDLVAVSMLGVDVPAHVSANLLEGPLGQAMARYLADIPTDVELADDASAELVADGSPAERAWTCLTKQRGVDWVTAAKLMARKRPRLIPIYDSVVRCWLGHPPRLWQPLRLELRRDDAALASRLQDLRQGLAGDISVLRVLDVLLWTQHHTGHQRTGCPASNRNEPLPP